jgi:two-component system, cell cycle sensor histidine kinase and response regulator CckA
MNYKNLINNENNDNPLNELVTENEYEPGEEPDNSFELEQIFENSVDGICIIEKGFKILRANSKFRSFLGNKTDCINGKKCYVEFYNELCDSDCPLIKIFSGETFFERDVVKKLPNGSVRYYILKSKPFVNKKGSFRGVIVFMQDVTERKELEEQFYNARKLETVARLAGGVAHDFNNMLTTIMGHSEIGLIKCTGDNVNLSQHFTEIKKTADRAADLVRQLLIFSRRQLVQPKVINPNIFLENMVKLLKKLLGDGIELEYIMDINLGNIKIDAGHFEQIITNLVINARDAMPEGGKLIIKTENIIFEEESFTIPKDLTPGEYILINVSDNGTGIPEQDMAHIFEPFFTTKKNMKGNGLGLSTCYGIVRRNSGHIEVRSTENNGTNIDIYLPISHEQVECISPVDDCHAPDSGFETILLAEDEASVRKMVANILNAKGYKVIQAANGEEAIELFVSEKNDSISLLLTDMVMPKMNGRELHEKLKELNPKLRALFVSAYSDDYIFENGFLESNAAFLEKPFSPRQLLNKVRETLDIGNIEGI